MAIDQTSLALSIAQQTVALSTQLLNILDQFEALKETVAASTGADIDLNDYETEIGAAPLVQHCSGATYQNIIDYMAPAISTHLSGLSTGTPTENGLAAFRKARKV